MRILLLLCYKIIFLQFVFPSNELNIASKYFIRAAIGVYRFHVHRRNMGIKIASGFSEKWNLPNCLGAADGKHIA